MQIEIVPEVGDIVDGREIVAVYGPGTVDGAILTWLVEVK